MPQSVLPILPSGSTSITDVLSVVNENGQWTYFHGMFPVFTHGADEYRTFWMFCAQQAAEGRCKLVDIERVFGVSAISVKRAVKKYREGGSKAFFTPRQTRGAAVLIPTMLKEIQELLDQGLSQNMASDQLGLKRDTIRKAIRAGKLHVKKKI